MNENATNERPASCPRCGYDQRGVVATWTENCPMTGTCTECGLNFHWPELLSEKVRRPSWCVEYARSWRFIAAAAKTLALSFWPWGFWRSLKMSHQPRWGRIFEYLMLLYLLPLLILPILNGLADAKIWMLFKFGQTQSAAALPGVNGGRWSTVHNTDVTFIEAFLRGVFMPLSPTSPGSVTTTTTTPPGFPKIAGGSAPYQSPLEQLESLVASGGTEPSSVTWNYFPSAGTPNIFGNRYMVGGTTAPYFITRWLQRLLTDALWLMLIALLSAAAFAALPQSRREAKVRWGHILRISLYSLAFPAFPSTLYLLGTHARFITGGLIDVSEGFMSTLAMLLIPVWFIWWSVATGRYLKMRHAWGVGLAVIVIAVLLTYAILFYGEQIINGKDPFRYSW